jgi:hypothetical protein
MNKPVLPISFDSLSLAKPAVKKPQLSETFQQESFAEQLSQSQRELKKDKTPDTVETKRREKTDVEHPRARVATDNSSHQKKHVKKKQWTSSMNRFHGLMHQSKLKKKT